MKERSDMIVIPENEADITLENVISRLSESTLFEVKKTEPLGENGQSGIKVIVENDRTEYEVLIGPSKIDIPEYFRTVHFFSDLDFEKINRITTGLAVEIEYTENFLASYHDQLKLINCLVPEKLAVVDIPSEKLLSGKWVKLSAESEVPPAPRYLFTVQAIYDGGDEVWLHTHGLKRCGMTELEILGSTKDMCSSHYSVIETMAVRMIENEADPQPYEPVFLAWLTEEIAMVGALIYWEEALEYYPEVKLGNAGSRDDYHAESTSVIMLYLTPDDADEENLSRVQELDEYLGQNTLLMISAEETDRMRRLAQERIDYVKKAASDPEVHVMMKIGLKMDSEFLDPEREEETQREHIWFELKNVTDGLFEAELTQEPYYVKNMHAGSIGKYETKDVTDWMIYANGNRYTPDDVYMM